MNDNNQAPQQTQPKTESSSSLTETPFENMDTSSLPPAFVSVTALAKQQFKEHGSANSKVIYTQTAWYDRSRIGYEGWARVILSITEDEMMYCNLATNKGLIFSVYLGSPNVVRLKNAAFWFTKVDSVEYDAKNNPSPFLVSFSSHFAASNPFGLAWNIAGKLDAKRFKKALSSIGIEC